MLYINATPNEAGNYGNPTGRDESGRVALPETLLADYIAAKGFVVLTVEDGEVTALSANEDALTAWESGHPEPTPTPDATEALTAQVDTVAKVAESNLVKITALQEANDALTAQNELLSAQVGALSDQNDFYEDCLVEMAGIVYA